MNRNISATMKKIFKKKHEFEETIDITSMESYSSNVFGNCSDSSQSESSSSASSSHLSLLNVYDDDDHHITNSANISSK